MVPLVYTGRNVAKVLASVMTDVMAMKVGLDIGLIIMCALCNAVVHRFWFGSCAMRTRVQLKRSNSRQ